MDDPTEYHGATVVACYGAKNPSFERWLLRLQQELRGVAGDTFRPRPIPEIHFTLIGLEYALRPVTGTDVEGVVRHFRDGFFPSVAMQFGGWPRDGDDFLSRGQTLFDRSFGVDGDTCVVIGWPVERGNPRSRATRKLAGLRRDAEDYGFRHRYHVAEADDDPDGYMVIGTMDPQPAHGDVVAAMRTFVSDRAVTVNCGARDVSVVLYRTPDLDQSHSAAYPVETVVGDTAQRVADVLEKRVY